MPRFPKVRWEKNNLNYNETIFLESNAESKTSKLRQQNVAFGAKLKSNWSKKFN